MERPNTVSGLIALHAEIAQQIEVQRRVMNRLVADIDAVEHTIRLLAPGVELPPTKRVPSVDGARKGEVRRPILAALRDANGPLSEDAITRQVMAARGLTDDAATFQLARKRVRAALWKIKLKGWAKVVPVGDERGWLRA